MKPSELKKTRKKLQISQLLLAGKTKVSRFRLSLFENGFLNLRNQELKKISTFLKASMKWRKNQ